MENANKLQQWHFPIIKGVSNIRPALVAGLGLTVILSGLAALNPQIGVGCALMLLLLVLILPRPIWIVYGLTFVLPLVGGLARGGVVPFLRVGQALLVIGFVLFVLAKSGRLGKSWLSYIDLAFVFFFLAGSVFPVLALLYRGEHLALNNTDNIYGVSALQTLLGPIQYYLLYRIVVATISSERQIYTVLKLSFVASIIISAIGVLEKAISPVRTFVETYYPPVAQNATASNIGVRIASTLEHYSGLGAYLSFMIILALACYAFQGRLKISPLLLAVTILLDSIALILTGTIAAWIGLAIGAIVVFILVGRLPKLVFFVLVGIILASFIFQSFIVARFNEQLGSGVAQGVVPASLAFRIMLWKEIFLPAIGQHLFFGAGPAPAALNSWSTEESMYFGLLLRGGLTYFFSYFLLIGVAIATCWKLIKSKSENEGFGKIVAIALLAILVAINFMNVSGEYFGYIGGTQIIWTLLALVVVSRQLKVVGALDIATATASVNGLDQEYKVRREQYWVGSYSLISIAPGVEVSWLDRQRQRFGWWKRILDWRFVKDSVVVGAGFTIARALGLLFLTLLAHFLTPDDFGFFRYSVSLMTIVTIASAGSPISIARFLAANPNDQQARDRYFSNGMFGVIILLAISLLISLPILWMLRALNLGTIICIVGYTGFFMYFTVARGLGSAWRMGLSYLLSNLVQIATLFVVLGFFKLRTPTAALVIYGLTYLSPFALQIFAAMKVNFRRSLISRSILWELARFAIPVVMASGAYTIWSGIDVLLIENFDPHAAGGYAAAKTLSTVFLFVPSVVSLVLMPKVAAIGPSKSKLYTAGAVLATFLICLIGVVIVDNWGHNLIALTFGERYSDAYPSLLVLSAGMSFLSIYVILEGFLVGRGQPKLAVQALAVALVSGTVSGFWLIPLLGPLGASLSFTISAALCTMVILFNTWRILQSDKQVVSVSAQALN